MSEWKFTYIHNECSHYSPKATTRVVGAPKRQGCPTTLGYRSGYRRCIEQVKNAFSGLLPTTRMSASDEYNTARGCAVIGLRHSLINIQSRSSCSRKEKRKTIPSTSCFPLCRADTIRIYHTPAPRTNPLTAC